MSTTRKLRDYKGWVYNPELQMFVNSGSYRYTSAAALIYIFDLDDDDHAPLMDLKKNPYEPLPTLEWVVGEWVVFSESTQNIKCAAVTDLCARIRAAFPHIDTPEGA